jgi:hypothetical protein
MSTLLLPSAVATRILSIDSFTKLDTVQRVRARGQLQECASFVEVMLCVAYYAAALRIVRFVKRDSSDPPYTLHHDS